MVIPLIVRGLAAARGKKAAGLVAKKTEQEAAKTFEEELREKAMQELDRRAQERLAQQHPPTTQAPAQQVSSQQAQPQQRPQRAATMTNNNNEPTTTNPAPSNNSFSSNAGEDNGFMSLFITLAAVFCITFFQITHMGINYSLAWTMLIWCVLLAISLSLLAFVMTRENFLHLITFYMIFSVVLFLFNYGVVWLLLKVMGDTLSTGIIMFLLIIVPPIIFLVAAARFPVNHTVKLIAEIALAVLLIIFLFLFIANYTIPLPENYIPINAQEGVVDGMGHLWSNIKEIGPSIMRGIDETRKRADPMYYVGQVDRSNDGPELGVRFEDVRPIDRYFLPEQQPIIQGYIVAQSFLDDSIFVTPSCQTINHQAGIGGTPSQPAVEVFRGQDAIFDCRFPLINRTGHYPVQVSGTFDFETWAYTVFDFVFDDKIRELARLGEDIHQTLNIERVPRAIFSQGPVEIGIGGSRLPIAVQQDPPHLQNAYIGFNVGSRWHNGEINRVHALELILPDGFTIGSCDRTDMNIEGPVPDENVVDAQGRPIYNKFIFTSTFDVDAPFTSVRCELQLERLDVLSELFSSDKATRTFIVSSQYRYTISQNTELRIQNY